LHSGNNRKIAARLQAFMGNVSGDKSSSWPVKRRISRSALRPMLPQGAMANAQRLGQLKSYARAPIQAPRSGRPSRVPAHFRRTWPCRPHGVPPASPGHVCSDKLYPFAFLPMAMVIQSRSSVGWAPKRSNRALALCDRADEFCLKKGGDLISTSGQGSGLVFGR
jgi:hypothetical protein